MSIGPKPTPRRFAIGLAGGAVAFTLVATLGYFLLGSRHAKTIASGSPARATASSGSALASPASVAVAAPPPFPVREIRQGKVPETNIWIDHFRVMRLPGDSGDNVLEAHQRCAAIGMGLCSEPQWSRACAKNPKLGEFESWTTTANAGGFVVRGGNSCASRKLVPGLEKTSGRTGLCCDRAIGVDSINSNRTFLTATAQQVLAVETLFNQKRAAALGPLLDDHVTIDHALHSRKVALGLLDDTFRKWPDQWIASSSCIVGMQKTHVVVHRSRWHRRRRAESSSWSADCEQTRFRGGQVAVVSTRYVFGGNGRLRSIEDSRMIREWSKP